MIKLRKYFESIQLKNNMKLWGEKKTYLLKWVMIFLNVMNAKMNSKKRKKKKRNTTIINASPTESDNNDLASI